MNVILMLLLFRNFSHPENGKVEKKNIRKRERRKSKEKCFNVDLILQLTQIHSFLFFFFVKHQICYFMIHKAPISLLTYQKLIRNCRNDRKVSKAMHAFSLLLYFVCIRRILLLFLIAYNEFFVAFYFYSCHPSPLYILFDVSSCCIPFSINFFLVCV